MLRDIKVCGKKLSIKDCNSFFSSVCGLMFDKMKDKDGALIYANSIWMPFIKHNLDLIFLDSEFKTIDIQKAVPLTLNPKTWKTYRCENAKYCLEVKTGLVNIKDLKNKKPSIEFLKGIANKSKLTEKDAKKIANMMNENMAKKFKEMK